MKNMAYKQRLRERSFFEKEGFGKILVWSSEWVSVEKMEPASRCIAKGNGHGLQPR